MSINSNLRSLISNFERKYNRLPSKEELKELKKSAIRLDKGEMASKKANKRRRYK